MARPKNKTPTTEPKDDRDLKPMPDVGSAPGGPPGVHEVPADQPQQIGVVPHPATFPIPPADPMTEGQIGGLGREALEAYWYGQRTRYDRGERLWDFTRMAVDGLWSLRIKVTIGPMLLAEATIPLDRLPSADGEHEVLKLVEAMAADAIARQRAARETQKNWPSEPEPPHPEPGTV